MTKMDVFIGYHADTCASIILHICHELCEENYNDSDSNINTSDDCEEEDEETDNINMWVNDNKDKVCNVIRKTNFPGYVNLENKIFFSQRILSKTAYSCLIYASYCSLNGALVNDWINSIEK